MTDEITEHRTSEVTAVALLPATTDAGASLINGTSPKSSTVPQIQTLSACNLSDVLKILGPLGSALRWYLTGSLASAQPKAPHILTTGDQLQLAHDWPGCSGAADFRTIVKLYLQACTTRESLGIGYVTGLEYNDFVLAVIDLDDHDSDKPPVLVDKNNKLTQLGCRLVALFVDLGSQMVLVSRGGRGIHIPLWIPKQLLPQIPKKVTYEDNHTGRVISIDVLINRFAVYSLNFISMNPIGEITEEKLLDALEQLGVSILPKPTHTEHTNLTSINVTQTLDGQTVARLTPALSSLSSDDRDLWIRVGLALKLHGDGGWELWSDWSKKSRKFPGELECRKVWDGLKPRGDVTIGTIIWEANQLNGYALHSPSSLNSPSAPQTKPGNNGSNSTDPTKGFPARF